MGASRVFGAKHHCALCFRFAGRIRRGVVSSRCESGSLWSVYYVYGESEQGEAERYARLPDSVLCDRRLSVTARCVYGVLARYAYQGTTVKIGQRRIAMLLGVHVETVNVA